ncbi:MAG: hypothetical protein R6V53_00015 [Candidatus Woesearchaeota archaeon]
MKRLICIFLLVFMIGCSTEQEIQPFDAGQQPDAQETEQDMQTETEKPPESRIESGEQESEQEKTQEDSMNFCESTKQTDIGKYVYYWTQDQYYEKVTSSNGGETEKIVTAQQSCARGDGDWQCSESSESLLQQHKGMVQQLVDSPADMYGLKCSEKPYNETIFQMD